MSAEIIRSHLRNGELQLAREAATLAIAGAPDEERGELYALLGRVLVRLGQPREALRAAEEAVHRTDHWEAVLAHGQALVGMGDPHLARALLSDALRRIRGATSAADEAPDAETGRHFAEDRPVAGLAHNTASAEVQLGVALAEACRAAGDPETGIGIATRAVAVAEASFRASSPEAAEALHALGLCRHAAGQHDEARSALQRALDLRRALETRGLEEAGLLDAMGMVERARGRPFKAVEYHRQALALWLERLGEHASPTGACRHALAQALHRTGDFVAAHEEMERAADITSSTLGEEHVDTWITRFELGRFRVDVGRVEEGFALMEAGRTHVRERLGADHPVVKAMDRWL